MRPGTHLPPAHHDPLTGLDNRLSLNLRLEQLLAQTRRSHGQAAVMFLDLDHFKKINDTHGHQAGDLLLREVDTIARLGGDEFIVVTNGDITRKKRARLPYASSRRWPRPSSWPAS